MWANVLSHILYWIMYVLYRFNLKGEENYYEIMQNLQLE